MSWASRWDTYLRMSDVQIHWFSIINSLVVVFFLSGILTMIMVRTLRQDIARYNTDDNYEDTLEETGKIDSNEMCKNEFNSKMTIRF